MSNTSSQVGPAERALTTADRLFYENGYAATGINQVISEAGVAKASLYRHYPAKTDLAMAYLELRRDAWVNDLKTEIDRHQTPRDRILAIFDFLLHWMPATDYRGCAFLNLAAEFPQHDSEIRARVRSTKQTARSYFADLALEAGLPGKGDQIFLLFEGATVQAQVFAEDWPILAARKAAEDLLAQA